jgi:2-iminobutanoate/2-iminopropanoate deaminase
MSDRPNDVYPIGKKNPNLPFHPAVRAAEEAATLADVVRVTTYLEDTRDFGRYNKVFAEHFKDAVLARTTVEARAVINTKIEMDAIAYKPKQT